MSSPSGEIYSDEERRVYIQDKLINGNFVWCDRHDPSYQPFQNKGKKIV